MRSRPLCTMLATSSLLLACGDSGSRFDSRAAQRQGSSPGEYVPRRVSSNFARLTWRLQDSNIGRPFELSLLSDSLALVLDFAHPFMHLIDVRNGEYIRPLDLAGDGSGETFNIYRVATSPDSALEFAGYDRIANTITRFRIGDAEHPLTITEVIPLNSVEAVDALVWHGDGSLSVEVMRDSALRVTVTSDGELGQFTGMAMSDMAPNWVPADVWREAMSGHTCPSPNRRQLARAWRFMGRLSILDSFGNRIRGTRDTQFFDARFIVRRSGEVVFGAQGGDVRNAYRSCAATRSRVFGLFSGRMARSSIRERGAAANQIHVYDWRGELKGGFRIRFSARAIDVTPSGRYLLALEDFTSPGAVTAYEIPRRYRSR